MIQYKGHQKRDAEVIKGNNKVDETAERVALEPVTWQLPLIPRRPNPVTYSPIYTKVELDKTRKWVVNRDLGGQE